MGTYADAVSCKKIYRRYAPRRRILMPSTGALFDMPLDKRAYGSSAVYRRAGTATALLPRPAQCRVYYRLTVAAPLSRFPE